MRTRTFEQPEGRPLPNRTIRAFLVEDSPLMMGLLARIVSKDKRVVVVGTAADGRKALCNATPHLPDLHSGILSERTRRP